MILRWVQCAFKSPYHLHILCAMTSLTIKSHVDAFSRPRINIYHFCVNVVELKPLLSPAPPFLLLLPLLCCC